MTWSTELVLQLATVVGAAVAVYAGIRVDLAVTRSKAEAAAESANQAHRRIDSLIGR